MKSSGPDFRQTEIQKSAKCCPNFCQKWCSTFVKNGAAFCGNTAGFSRFCDRNFLPNPVMIGRPIWIVLAALFEEIENQFPPKCEYNSTKTKNTKSPKPRPRFGGFWFPTCKKMGNKYSRIRNFGYHFFKKRDHGITNFATFCGGGIGSRNVSGPAIVHTTGHPQGKQTPQGATPIGTAPRSRRDPIAKPARSVPGDLHFLARFELKVRNSKCRKPDHRAD